MSSSPAYFTPAPPPLFPVAAYAAAIRGTELKFFFNGFPEEHEATDLTVQELLDRTNEDDPSVIVEINGRFIYRKDFATHTIHEGDRVEFIHPSFGG